MSSWDDGSQTTPLAKLPFQPLAATITWRNNSPFGPGIHLFLGNDKLWSSKHFMFDIWHFPKRPNPTLTVQWNGDKDASFFREGQCCFGRARGISKHLPAEEGPKQLRSPEKRVWVCYHLTLLILIFGLIVFRIFTASGNCISLKWFCFYEHFFMNGIS